MDSVFVTKRDFDEFKLELRAEIRLTLQSLLPQQQSNLPKGLKTKEVRSLLGCSTNKLVSLRISRKIRTKKIGGTLYYNTEDIKQILEDGF